MLKNCLIINISAITLKIQTDMHYEIYLQHAVTYSKAQEICMQEHQSPLIADSSSPELYETLKSIGNGLNSATNNIVFWFTSLSTTVSTDNELNCSILLTRGCGGNVGFEVQQNMSCDNLYYPFICNVTLRGMCFNP